VIAVAPGYLTIKAGDNKAISAWYDNSRMSNKPGSSSITPAVVGGTLGVGAAATWYRMASRAATSTASWAEMNTPLLAEGLELAPVFSLV